MPKRKRESRGGHGISIDRIQQKKDYVTQILARDVKQVSRALKAGKGFERQKLAKRSKIATEKDDEDLVRRLGSEIKALKALDLSSLASHHLYKSLLKIKSIASSPALPFGQEDISPVAHDAATLNVAARMYSSNPVKIAIERAIDDVTRVLGVGSSKPQKFTTLSRSASSTGSPGARVHSGYASGGSDKNEDAPEHMRLMARSRGAYRASAMPLENTNHSMDETAFEDFATFDHRIASSSESSDREEDSHETTAKRPVSEASDLSPYSSTSSPPPPKLSQARSEASPKIKVNQSAFLPSLTMGGYISGSESGTDNDLDVAPTRKNRRGQRARQQIWEKKYGSKAKHLQNQKHDPKTGDRNKGWDSRKGAIEGQRARFAKGKKAIGRTGQISTDANAIQVSNSRVGTVGHQSRQLRENDDGPLHPSWEAKKKAKEQQKQVAAFQGKKITFD